MTDSPQPTSGDASWFASACAKALADVLVVRTRWHEDDLVSPKRPPRYMHVASTAASVKRGWRAAGRPASLKQWARALAPLDPQARAWLSAKRRPGVLFLHDRSPRVAGRRSSVLIVDDPVGAP